MSGSIKKIIKKIPFVGSYVKKVQAEKKEEEARIGITLSKKIGHAVDRNLYKRQIRMMCQELVDFKQYPYDIILIVRFGYRDNNYQTNKNNLEKLLIKATIK